MNEKVKSDREVELQEHIRNMVQDYDVLIRKLIPDYDAMQGHVIYNLNLTRDREATVVDIGVGTGETANRILSLYPKAKVIGMDFNADMVSAATQRLAKFGERAKFITDDMRKAPLPQGVDAVVSTLAIHHLEHEDKRDLFGRIFESLKPGGMVSVGEIVTFRDPEKAKRTEAEWKKFIIGNLGEEQGQYRFDEYKKGDIPAPLEDQLQWLEDTGFKNIEVSWDKMNYAVFSASRPE
jgi:tRNA (cmo5U34)-methyltransferase